jgi:hypothetical protein
LIVHNCGFGGGRGALQNMAANYGMHLDDGQAKEIVTEWRAANPWAVDFWYLLRDKFREAMDTPNYPIACGMLVYTFLPDYLGGSMLCRLPSGRTLTYRHLKWTREELIDDKGEVKLGEWELTFARGFGRVKLWHGILAENVTQAVAADVLRSTLVRMRETPSMPVVRAHTHDEILVEVHVDRAEDVAERLVAVMEQGFEWSAGLPLKAEATVGYSYSKCESAHGL